MFTVCTSAFCSALLYHRTCPPIQARSACRHHRPRIHGVPGRPRHLVPPQAPARLKTTHPPQREPAVVQFRATFSQFPVSSPNPSRPLPASSAPEAPSSLHPISTSSRSSVPSVHPFGTCSPSPRPPSLHPASSSSQSSSLYTTSDHSRHGVDRFRRRHHPRRPVAQRPQHPDRHHPRRTPQAQGPPASAPRPATHGLLTNAGRPDTLALAQHAVRTESLHVVCVAGLAHLALRPVVRQLLLLRALPGLLHRTHLGRQQPAAEPAVRRKGPLPSLQPRWPLVHSSPVRVPPHHQGWHRGGGRRLLLTPRPPTRAAKTKLQLLG